MRQFFDADASAFSELEQKARAGCVVFDNQEMPVTIMPRHMRVGFEVLSDDAVSLYIIKGGTYSGSRPSISAWIDTGRAEFPNFESMRHWLESELAAEYTATLANGGGQPPSRLESLSDFSEVRNANSSENAPITIDGDEFFDQLSQEVRGQDESLKRLCGRIARHLARTDPRRPATFFAVGPTGVGKTQTAESMATILNKMTPGRSTSHFIRLDMSEYQEQHRISQLFGSPQGYVGYGDGSQLSEQLTSHPNSVVLFDEIEKAHPDVLRALMNAMDAGRLSTSHKVDGSRQIDCRKAIFFFTSNLESEGILRELRSMEDAGKVTSHGIDELCRRNLRRAGVVPELISRIGSFLVYRNLDNASRAEIMALSIVRVASEYGLKITYIAPESLSSILSMNEASRFGTRPDEYMIDELLGDIFSGIPIENRGGDFELSGSDPYYLRPAERNVANN